jgi:hypothetical protein
MMFSGMVWYDVNTTFRAAWGGLFAMSNEPIADTQLVLVGVAPLPGPPRLMMSRYV